MKRIFALISLALMILPLQAQLKTYLTMEAGPHWGLITVEDPGNYFMTASALSSIAGLTLEQEVIENLSVITGIYYQPYKTGINMIDKRPQQPVNPSHTAMMIPVRLQYRIQPTDLMLGFTPRIGYVYSMNSTPGDHLPQSSVLSAPDGTAFSYNYQQLSTAPGKHLLEVGIGVDLLVSGLWKASVSLSYLNGVLNESAPSATLDYSNPLGNAYSATYNIRGNGIYSTLAFSIPVSNIWQNKDYRVRARIENSVSAGKPIERKGLFYIGGEFGSLWRLFYTSSPAIGARPMEGRSPFQYANFHAGGYAGFMLTNEIGIDLGVNYQRSSTFYALMYDHEVDFAGKEGAPMYLEVPLRIRYHYEVVEDNLFAVAYGGASLLTHFSSGGYASPGGDFSYTDPATQAPTNGTTSSTTERLSQFRPLLRMGAGMEYRLPIDLPLFLTGYINYMQGFMAVEQVMVTTSVPGGTTSLVYQGSGWSVDLGIKIPFSFDDRQNCVRLTKKRGK
ncbi:MAG: hypothetical protein ABFS10_12970 [Bacteroidota bacterium]